MNKDKSERNLGSKPPSNKRVAHPQYANNLKDHNFSVESSKPSITEKEFLTEVDSIVLTESRTPFRPVQTTERHTPMQSVRKPSANNIDKVDLPDKFLVEAKEEHNKKSRFSKRFFSKFIDFHSNHFDSWCHWLC